MNFQETKASPYYNDPFFVAGYLAAHTERLSDEMVLSKDVANDKFVQSLLSECAELASHLSNLLNGEQPAERDENRIGLILATFSGEPVIRMS